MVRPHGSTERGSPAWHRPFEEGAGVGTAFDERMDNTRHLGGNCCKRFAPPIRVIAVLGDIVAREEPISIDDE